MLNLLCNLPIYFAIVLARVAESSTKFSMYLHETFKTEIGKEVINYRNTLNKVTKKAKENKSNSLYNTLTEKQEVPTILPEGVIKLGKRKPENKD